MSIELARPQQPSVPAGPRAQLSTVQVVQAARGLGSWHDAPPPVPPAPPPPPTQVTGMTPPRLSLQTPSDTKIDSAVRPGAIQVKVVVAAFGFAKVPIGLICDHA